MSASVKISTENHCRSSDQKWTVHLSGPIYYLIGSPSPLPEKNLDD